MTIRRCLSTSICIVKAVKYIDRDKPVRALDCTCRSIGAMPTEFITSSRSCYEPGHAGLVSRCSFHPRQPVLACAIEGGRVCVYQQQENNLIDSSIVAFQLWKETILHGTTNYPVLCLEWSVDGKRLAVGCKNGTVILWSLEGRLLFERRKHTDFVWSIRWNPIQLNIFATGSNDKSVVVWDADKKPSPLVQRLVLDDGDPIHHVVWLSEKQFASFSKDQNDGIIHICQIGKETPTMTFVHGDSIDSIKWNSHLKLLASVSSCSTESVQVWSLNQIDPVKRWNKMTSDVSCIDWFPGREINEHGHSTCLIAGGCVDGSIFVWNLNDEARHEISYFDGHQVEINDVSFSPNGKLLASIDRDGNLIIRLTKGWRKAFETRIHPPTHWQEGLSWNGTSDKLAIANISCEVFVVESKNCPELTSSILI